MESVLRCVVTQRILSIVCVTHLLLANHRVLPETKLVQEKKAHSLSAYNCILILDDLMRRP